MLDVRKRSRQEQSEWISLAKAAAILGRHSQTVARMAAREEIGFLIVDTRMFVSRTDVERLARERESAA